MEQETAASLLVEISRLAERNAGLARDFVHLSRDIRINEQSECWEWVGYTRLGYGRTSIRRKQGSVHRIVYEMFKGPIREGLTLDHLCRNRCCVNPDHLEPCTLEVNVQRGWATTRHRRNNNAEKTHCPRGHEYNFRGDGSRKCRVCDRERKVERRRNDLEFLEQERARRRASYHRNKGETLPAPGKRTHCPKGHKYTAATTYYTADGGRGCIVCRRDRWYTYGKAWQRRKRRAAGIPERKRRENPIKHKPSPYPNVYWVASSQKWKAMVTLDGVTHHLGVFTNARAARSAVVQFRRERTTPRASEH